MVHGKERDRVILGMRLGIELGLEFGMAWRGQVVDNFGGLF